MIVALLALALAAPTATVERADSTNVYGRSARARQQAPAILDDLRIAPSKRG